MLVSNSTFLPPTNYQNFLKWVSRFTTTSARVVSSAALEVGRKLSDLLLLRTTTCVKSISPEITRITEALVFERDPTLVVGRSYANV